MIARFFSWWFGELAALLPAGRRRGSSRGRALVIAIVGEQVHVGFEGTRGRTRIVPRGDTARLREVVQEVASGLDAARTRVQVRVPEAIALSTRPKLPLAAEENLREVLGFEMDRLTPFRASDVYYAYRVEERDRTSAQISVVLDVVRRAVVDPLIAGLEQWSLGPSSSPLPSDAAETPGRLVTLEFTPSRFRQRSPLRLNIALGVAVAVLAAMVVYVPVTAQREYREKLDVELSAARGDAAQALAVREQIDLELKAAQILADAKGARPSSVELLETVSRLLPDHTYLFRFELRGSELSIQGSSQAASSLIALLDGSERLTNVRFVSPVTRDARSGGERFHISAQLVSPVAAAAQAGGQG